MLKVYNLYIYNVLIEDVAMYINNRQTIYIYKSTFSRITDEFQANYVYILKQ